MVAAAAIALIAAAGVLARSLAGPDPQARAAADGCERNDTTMLQGLSPNWARVFDANAPASGPPPPLQTVQPAQQNITPAVNSRKPRGSAAPRRSGQGS